MKTRQISWKDILAKTVIVIPIVLMMILCLIPFFILLSSSVTPNEVVSKGVTILPVKGFTFLAYRLLFAVPGDILKAYGTSIIITVGGTILNVFLCSLIAYPLSDSEFRWRKPITFFVFFTMLFQVGLIPQYITISRMFHLNDTLFILILMPSLAPGHILFLKVYFQNVDKAIYESARMDGANELQNLFIIGLPLITPGLVTICFQFVIMYWNDAYTSLYFADTITPVALYLQRWSTYIQQLKIAASGGLAGLVTSAEEIPDVTVQFALGVVTTLPLLIIFMFFQKYYVRGLTSGAVKG